MPNLERDLQWYLDEATRCMNAHQFERAVEHSEKVVALKPEVSEFHERLGIARDRSGMKEAAIAALRKAIELDRDNASPLMNLARLLFAQRELEGAAACLGRSLALNPGLAEAHLLLAEILMEKGDLEAPQIHFRRAAELNPKSLVAQGACLQVWGKFSEAENCLQQALTHDPADAAALFALVRCRKQTEADRPRLECMQAILAGRPSAQNRMYLHYGLGKSFEDLGDYRRAMQHFDEANGAADALRPSPFDRSVHQANTDWRIDHYTSAFFAKHRSFGTESDLPVLVVGMIRSGTTLVEQVLSSHPQVGGAGELRFWYEHQSEINRRVANGTLDESYVKALAGRYLALLDLTCPNRLRVLDKMPMNFLLMGPVHLALPNARFIHCRRNPLDNCLSIYTTYFESSPPFAHRQENILFYYREYERLMQHWRSLLPPDRLLEIVYDDLIAEPEKVIRKMVAFCALEWDPACIRHQDNPHPVRTPSLWQVRQPIYASSKERWRNFEPWLGDLEELKP